MDSDPELAWRHAEAARRRAGRLPVVREAAAETAYAAGKYDVALREFRALRRMMGGDQLVPLMADCERALGRHRDALDLLESMDQQKMSGVLAVEALLVEAGTRKDMGQRGEAMRLLKNGISHKVGPKLSQARLRYAYADMLLEAGQPEAAREWFEVAGRLDVEGDLDVVDRLAELDGVVLPETLELEADEEDAVLAEAEDHDSSGEPEGDSEPGSEGDSESGSGQGGPVEEDGDLVEPEDHAPSGELESEPEGDSEPGSGQAGPEEEDA